jgi:hypothetical protein
MAKSAGADPVRVFARQVRSRSAEHAAAIRALGREALHAVSVGILRQELDSMVRVMFLLSLHDQGERRRLIEDSVGGRRWRGRNGKIITDREMVRLANALHGWAESVYRFGCAFIHLSNFHDRLARDPFKSLPTSERRDIIGHIEYYHGHLATKTPGMEDLLPLIPGVFTKVADNLRCYLDSLERGGHLDL